MSTDSAEVEVIAQLKRDLLAEKQRSAWLTKEVERMRHAAAEISQAVEAEEEMITNRMMKRLMDLKKEKEQLAVEVEREEEHMTNTLQRKLTQADAPSALDTGFVSSAVAFDMSRVTGSVELAHMAMLRQEKVDLENQLEREQEYLVNKLQKQLAQVVAEKERLALEVEREEEFLTNTMGKKLEVVQGELAAAVARVVHERIHVSEPLRAALTAAQQRSTAVIAETRAALEAMAASLKTELEGAGTVDDAAAPPAQRGADALQALSAAIAALLGALARHGDAAAAAADAAGGIEARAAEALAQTQAALAPPPSSRGSSNSLGQHRSGSGLLG